MGDLVNLRRERKRRARDHEHAQAAQARLLHGRGRTERLAQQSETARAAALLDGARLDEAEPDHGRRNRDRPE